MGKIERNPNGTLSRRGFLEGAAGLTFALSIPGALFVRPAAALAEGATPGAVGAWVTIGPDGAIVLAIPVAEMGQGSSTGLAMVFAEEMDADWSRVSITYPPVKPEIFGNPIFGNMMVTYGSGSTRGYWDKVRLQAAAVRNVLMQAAADRWQVPLGELRTGPSMVVHAASNRSMSYGEIAGFAQVPATMPTIDKSALKKMADYRILGKNTPRFDIPGKIDGSAQYSIDVQVPNMVYATVLRTPVEGGTPEHVDDAAALAVPGVLKMVPLKNSVGVVAETIEAAFKGRVALQGELVERADRHVQQRGRPEGVSRPRRQARRQGRELRRQGRRRRSLRQGGQGDDRAILLRIRLSRADGADERHRVGQSRRRQRRNLDRDAGRQPQCLRRRGDAQNHAGQDQAQSVLSRRRLWPAQSGRHASGSPAAGARRCSGR